MGIDPGGTTGVACIHNDGLVAHVIGTEQIDVRDDDGLLAFGQLVRNQIKFGYDIAIERFFITNRTLKLTRQSDAMEIIGIVRYLCLKGGGKMTLQSAADAKTIWSDARLDANIAEGVIVHPPKKSQVHARDALRHALLLSGFVGIVVAL